MIPDIDPERVRVGFAAFAGAFVYGVFTLVTLFMTGAHVSRADFFRAAVNVVAAALCGVVAAVIVTAPLSGLIPWQSMRDQPTIAFVIGAVFWELLPFAFKAMKNRAAKEAANQGASE